MKSEIYVKPFKDYSSTWTFSVLPFHPLTRKNAWALLDSAWKYFCVLQHKQKFHITNLPIVYVDHPLDKTIPFVPSNIRIYMDFVNFFCRIIKMFVSRLKRDGYILSAKILEFIRKLYIDAAAVYTHSLSTTRRPFYLGKPKFFMVHFLDPHYLCVPSLHVAIVAGLWAKVRELLSETELSDEEKKSILDEIYTGSVAITESVLLVKQHSINCVAGALYMLSASNPEGFFKKEDVENFVRRLFENDSYVAESDKEKIRNHIISMYNDLLGKKNSQTEWQKPLHDWLDNYKA